MTDTQIDILKTATDWAKPEMFSSGFFVLFGLAFCLSSYCFWQFGKTDTAKAYLIPSRMPTMLRRSCRCWIWWKAGMAAFHCGPI